MWFITSICPYDGIQNLLNRKVPFQYWSIRRILFVISYTSDGNTVISFPTLQVTSRMYHNKSVPHSMTTIKFDVYWSMHRCDSQWTEEPTRCYLVFFITLMICSTRFGHLYDIHQELTIIYHCSPHGTSASWGLDGGKEWVGWLCGRDADYARPAT
jgi:hypothetical protein